MNAAIGTTIATGSHDAQGNHEKDETDLPCAVPEGSIPVDGQRTHRENQHHHTQHLSGKK
jgi:hypothetical protein